MYFREKSYAQFIENKPKSKVYNAVHAVLKNPAPFCGFVLLVTYVFKWIGFKLDEEISQMLFPLLVFGLIPFSYVHFFILRNQVYQLYLMNRYSEKYREILGEKEVNFYGTAYQTSHEVMNRIRAYKEDKNIKFEE